MRAGQEHHLLVRLAIFCHQLTMTSISDDRKKSRGRPRVGSTSVGVRLPPAELAALDAHIAAQPDPKPSRPEAIRRVLAERLGPPRDESEAGGRKRATKSALDATEARSRAGGAADVAMQDTDATADEKVRRRRALTDEPNPTRDA